MAIQDLKITTYADNIKSLSDYPSNDGVSAAQLKALFDGRTDKEIKTNFNGLVDEVDNHVSDTENPHTVTKTQVGLGNVDNTPDLNKPVSTLQAAAIAGVQADVDAHEADTDNPHSVTAEQIPIDDIGDVYSADNVEAALQEVADKNYMLTVQVDLHKNDEDNPHNVTATQLGLDVTKSNVAYAHATSAIGGANLFDQERWNDFADEMFQNYTIPLANSDFEVGGTYIASGDVSSVDEAFINMYDENEDVIGFADISSGQSFTIPEGTVSIQVGLFSQSMSLNPDELIPIMINEGSTALPYEPYIAHTANPHNVTAAQISIADTGEHFTAETVENALQEIAGSVTTLETNKVDTSSIVNDLTTGGATAPLSAEQGKTLKGLFDDNVFSITNYITNGDFSNGTASWAGGQSTISVTDNTLACTGDGSSETPNLRQYVIIPNNVGHKIFIKARIRVTNANCNSLTWLFFGGTSGNQVDYPKYSPPVENEWYELSMITTITSAVVGDKLSLWFRHDYSTTALANGSTMEVQYVSAIDLTDIFGTGNEPTKEEMDELLKLFPNNWFDGTITLTQKQTLIWALNLIRINTNAIVAIGGS